MTNDQFSNDQFSNDQFSNDQLNDQTPKSQSIVRVRIEPRNCHDRRRSFGILVKLELPWSLVLGHWSFAYQFVHSKLSRNLLFLRPSDPSSFTGSRAALVALPSNLNLVPVSQPAPQHLQQARRDSLLRKLFYGFCANVVIRIAD